MRNKILAATAVLSIAGVCLIGKMNNVRADTTTQPGATQPAATMPATTTASAINWDEAAKHVGETVTVTGPVAGTHVTTGGKALVLNIGKDYPAPDRFSVMIKTDDKDKASPDTYMGKTISVTGKIELFRKVPEIKANVGDVTIVP